MNLKPNPQEENPKHQIPQLSQFQSHPALHLLVRRLSAQAFVTRKGGFQSRRRGQPWGLPRGASSANEETGKRSFGPFLGRREAKRDKEGNSSVQSNAVSCSMLAILVQPSAKGWFEPPQVWRLTPPKRRPTPHTHEQ